MTCYANKKRTHREFEVGEEVFLKFQPYRQMSLEKRVNHKPSLKYYGPYKMIKRVGKVSYQLKLPTGAKLHPTFYVSQLKKKIGAKKVVQNALHFFDEDNEEAAVPELVLERRLVKKENRPAIMVLVQWKNGVPKDAT